MRVELWRVTTDAEVLICESYGICTNKNVPVENIPKWIKMGHESPLEHASATFLIEDISRSCLAQLTRHRLASFSVQSMRYVNVAENEIVVPEHVNSKGWYNYTIYSHAIKHAQEAYEKLVGAGVPKEDARFVLPLATTTNLIMTANFREWRHIIDLRTHKSAQWEIQELANRILDILVEQAPNVFSDLSQGKE